MLRIQAIPIATLTACITLGIIAPPVAFADGKATGIITIGGQLFAAGKVTLYRDNGQFVGCKVKNGEFLIDHIPVGTFKVTIEGKGVPHQYESDDTTPLVVEVKDGENSINFKIN
jgi:hypothetical protein